MLHNLIIRDLLNLFSSFNCHLSKVVGEKLLQFPKESSNFDQSEHTCPFANSDTLLFIKISNSKLQQNRSLKVTFPLKMG